MIYTTSNWCIWTNDIKFHVYKHLVFYILYFFIAVWILASLTVYMSTVLLVLKKWYSTCALQHMFCYVYLMCWNSILMYINFYDEAQVLCFVILKLTIDLYDKLFRSWCFFLSRSYHIGMFMLDERILYP